MASNTKTFSRDSEVATLIAELLAAGRSLRITVGDESYVLALVADAEDRPDPERVARSIAGIERAAGSWNDEDTDAFLDYIYQRRNLPPRPPVEL